MAEQKRSVSQVLSFIEYNRTLLRAAKTYLVLTRGCCHSSGKETEGST